MTKHCLLNRIAIGILGITGLLCLGCDNDASGGNQTAQPAETRQEADPPPYDGQPDVPLAQRVTPVGTPMRERGVRIQPADTDRLAQPAFMVQGGHLTINGISFVMDEMPIETLEDIIGSADWEVERGAYTTYLWESFGVEAMVGYTGNVQFIHLWYEPEVINEQFDVELVPFPGSMLIEGYEAQASLSFYAWEEALDNDVSLHSFNLPGFSIQSSPCDLSIELVSLEDALMKVQLSND